MARDIHTKARLSKGVLTADADIGKGVLTVDADIGNTVYVTEVHSVNGKAGHVVLTAEDVGALPLDTPIPSLDGYATLADIPTNVSAFNNDAGYLTEHQDISGKADKSEIPTKTSELTNDSGFLTQHQDLSSYALKSELPTVPTDVSAFTNDVGYLTQHQDLSSYALKSTVYTKTQIDTALSGKSDKATTLSGYGIADAYTKTEVNNLVEGSGVTSVNGQTGTVTITASDLGAMTGMTILSYGHSAWNDFIEAYNANRIVYCKASTAANPASGEQRRMAFLAYFETNTAEFQYYRSVSNHTNAQQGDQVMIYQLRSNNTWTVTTRPASSRVVAGSGLSSAYASGTLTLSLDTDNQNKIDTLWSDYQSRT